MDSAGTEAANAQQARDNLANSTVPPAPPPAVAPPTNADRYQPENVDATDSALRRITDTQSTPPITARPGGIPGRVSGDLVDGETSTPAPTPTNTAGVGAAGDDAKALASFIDQTFSSQVIKAQSNVLDQFASYTYNISIYIMDANDYKRMLRTKQRNIAGYQLLLRSGGAGSAGTLVPNDQITAEDPQLAAQERVANLGRNEFFSLDYYIDDIKINHMITGKGTGGAHSATDMTFKIIEPNGITFLNNLYAATQQYVGIKGGRGPQNYAAQNYLMVIRFYGYDSTGRLITNQKLDVENLDARGNVTVNKATIEKFIPFQFTAVKFRVANRLTEYECTAVCPQNNVATGPARGVVPYNVEIQGQTLKDLLLGNLGFASTQAAQTAAGRTGTTAALPPVGTDPEFDARIAGAGSTAGTFGTTDELNQALGVTPPAITAGRSPTQNQAPPKASAAPKPSLVTGLKQALNNFEREKVDAGKQKFPDNYDIVIVSDALANARLKPPGEVNLKQTPMIKAEDPAQAKLGTKQAVANDVKSNKILAGQSIVQFLDQAIRSSSYVYNQQLKIISSKTGDIITNADPAKTVAWFKIGLQAVPQGDSFYDAQRNDFAYDITYQISPYAVSDVKSDWFPKSQFRGTHKRYDYWFTGKNTQILDLQQDYNYLFYIVQTAPKGLDRNLYNTRELEKAFTQPNSNQTNQGQDKNTNEPQANATDYLYSPADQSKIRMRIVGDPAWIQQGELSNGIQGARFNYDAFLPDGTISYDSQDILFEVNFNTPEDYDLISGIMDPTTKNFNQRVDSQGRRIEGGDARQSFVYQAIRCTSIFNRGRFEQELEGVLRTWPDPSQQTKAATADKTERAAQASKSQSTTRTAQIDLPEASPGLVGLDFGEQGSVNYRPTSLSTVLDSQRPRRSLTSSSLAAEGFDNQALGLPDNGAPTSGTEVIGPVSSGPAAVTSQPVQRIKRDA